MEWQKVYTLIEILLQEGPDLELHSLWRPTYLNIYLGNKKL